MWNLSYETASLLSAGKNGFRLTLHDRWPVLCIRLSAATRSGVLPPYPDCLSAKKCSGPQMHLKPGQQLSNSMIANSVCVYSCCRGSLFTASLGRTVWSPAAFYAAASGRIWMQYVPSRSGPTSRPQLGRSCYTYTIGIATEDGPPSGHGSSTAMSASVAPAAFRPPC